MNSGIYVIEIHKIPQKILGNFKESVIYTCRNWSKILNQSQLIYNILYFFLPFGMTDKLKKFCTVG